MRFDRQFDVEINPYMGHEDIDLKFFGENMDTTTLVKYIWEPK